MALHLVTGYAGEEHITASDAGSFNIATIGAGNYVLNHGNNFAANLWTNNIVRILDGDLVLQGRHVRLAAGLNEEIPIANGSQGKMRNDLICVRYEKSPTLSTESVSFVVIEGEEVAANPVDPEYNTGLITDGNEDITDFPLYRIRLTGLVVADPEPLFTPVENIASFRTKIQDTISNIEKNTETVLEKDFILTNMKPLTFVDDVARINDARIKADSLADVYFTTDCLDVAKKSGIGVETYNGYVLITADKTPVNTLTASIKIRVV